MIFYQSYWIWKYQYHLNFDPNTCESNKSSLKNQNWEFPHLFKWLHQALSIKFTKQKQKYLILNNKNVKIKQICQRQRDTHIQIGMTCIFTAVFFRKGFTALLFKKADSLGWLWINALCFNTTISKPIYCL